MRDSVGSMVMILVVHSMGAADHGCVFVFTFLVCCRVVGVYGVEHHHTSYMNAFHEHIRRVFGHFEFNPMDVAIWTG